MFVAIIAATILLQNFGMQCVHMYTGRKDEKIRQGQMGIIDCGVAGKVSILSILTSNYACMPQALLFSKYIFKMGILCTHQHETKMKSALKDNFLFS
jgi:hypothetical protein